MNLKKKGGFEEESEDILSDEDLNEGGDSLSDDDLFKEDLGVNDDIFGSNDQTAGEKYSDLLKELTNFNVYIKNKINGWLGLVWDGEKERYMRDPSLEPIMNKKCAQWCIDFMKTYTRGNNIITDISSRDYSNLYMDIASVVWIDLGTKAEEFEITNNQDLHKVGIELIHSALLVLMGAGDGKYNKLLGTATQRNENVSYQMNPFAGMNPQNNAKMGMFAKMKKALQGG